MAFLNRNDDDIWGGKTSEGKFNSNSGGGYGRHGSTSVHMGDIIHLHVDKVMIYLQKLMMSYLLETIIFLVGAW